MYNVITSVGRLKNISTIKKHLEPLDIKWHVITDEDLGFGLNFSEPWIKNYICPNNNVEFWARCHGALNWFIETQDINDNEIYSILNDDDGYEPDFFKKVDETINYVKTQNSQVTSDSTVVIVSMLRGHNIPSDAVWPRTHPIFPRYASQENLKPGSVGLEQILLSGKILKQNRLSLDVDGDGQFIMQAASNKIVIFAPHVNALFNYFEPGRWNK